MSLTPHEGARGPRIINGKVLSTGRGGRGRRQIKVVVVLEAELVEQARAHIEEAGLRAVSLKSFVEQAMRDALPGLERLAEYSRQERVKSQGPQMLRALEEWRRITSNNADGDPAAVNEMEQHAS